MLTKHSYFNRLVIIACLATLLSSCGFRLRGGVEVTAELKVVYIAGIAEFSDLYQELKRLLQRSGSTLSARPTLDAATLSIADEGMTKRVLSVDAQGRAAEYELIYRFVFTVTTRNDKQDKGADSTANNQTILVPSQRISITRDFRFDPNNILATDAQEKQIRVEMVRFSVQQVLRRIQSHFKHTKGKQAQSAN